MTHPGVLHFQAAEYDGTKYLFQRQDTRSLFNRSNLATRVDSIAFAIRRTVETCHCAIGTPDLEGNTTLGVDAGVGA